MSLQDRSNYFKMLLILIGKDRKIDSSEKIIFRELSKILGFSHEFCEEVMNELLENEYILEEPYKFESEEIAKTLIKDGIRIAFSDKELHLYEMNWLKMIAEKNGISEEWCLTEYNNYKSTPNSTYKYEIERYLGQNLDNSIN